jgi:hypothetical protein
MFFRTPGKFQPGYTAYIPDDNTVNRILKCFSCLSWFCVVYLMALSLSREVVPRLFSGATTEIYENI